MSKLEDLKYPLNLYLDEFTNYGAIPGIARYLTVIRNAGGRSSLRGPGPGAT
jgi:type IV secretory pathway TraG/TraD family ATPase VirD4